MTDQWSEETTTHQDHVIAHVIGATVFGYFVHDEAVHLLLDMGFIWTIYLDGQMVLLPQAVAINELEVESRMRADLKREIEQLEADQRDAEALKHIAVVPAECLITEVSFWANNDRRQLILAGEGASLVIETSLGTAQIEITSG